VEEARLAEEAKREAARPKVYGECRPVYVGYTFYIVECSSWSDKLSANEFLDHPPNAKYLFVLLSVTNRDKKRRMIPPFKLVDEDDTEYDADDHAWAVKGSIGLLENLNPNVSKMGFVVFDVPENRKYRIKLSGGFWSVKDSYVRLSPKASFQEAKKAALAKMEKLQQLGKELSAWEEKEAKTLAELTPEQVTERLNQRIDELDREKAE
jgi:F0F1-type ATP synthase epsilon subunit